MIIKKLSYLLIGPILFLSSANAAPAPDGEARELLAGGRMNDALHYLKERTQSAPDDAEAFHLLSRAYYELEQWDQSVNAAQRAAQLVPDNSEYHLWLGRAYGNKAEHSMWFTAIGSATRKWKMPSITPCLTTKREPMSYSRRRHCCIGPGGISPSLRS